LTEAANAATEVVAEAAEEVAEQATQVADISRGLSGRDLGLVFGGLVVGAGLGGAFGYFWAKRQMQTKYSELAAEEIAEMREHYNAKVRALENQTEKPKLEDIVREQGYARETTEPPMAVTPPSAVVEAVAEEETVAEEAEAEPEVINAFEQYGDGVLPKWDAHQERRRRSPLRPYVIHIDERQENPSYDEVEFTYFEDDDVLCNERNEIVEKDERDALVGEENLGRFGHGSNEPDVVYIRNDRLEMDIEVTRSPNSYTEEVLGYEPDPEPEIRHSHRRERMPFDDE
jgi:hypothetical protein